MDEYEWLKRRVKLITTDNPIYKKINSENDYISTFRPGAWTMLKELLLAYYAPQYITILRKRDWINELCYVDLFAGSGVITLKNLGKNYLGSPLIVKYAIKKNFDKYYFFDNDEGNINQLKDLIQDKDSSFFYGDSNIEIDRILPELSKQGVHSLIFIDPFATEIKFDTIRKLSNIGCDLMINVAAEEVKRAVDQYYSQNWNTNALDGFFGGEKWKTDLANIASDKEIYDYYAQKIVEEAGKKRPSSTTIYKTLNGHHYYILFTSTWGNGERPKFFNIIDDFNKHIENIDGNRMMKFIENNIENDNTLDRFADDKNEKLF
jgi:three-Cys-motif partner protein